MSEWLPDLCEWRLPEDSRIQLDCPFCVCERSHDGPHMVYETGGRKTLYVYEVNEEERTIKVRMHAQVKLPFTRVDAAALVALMEAAYQHGQKGEPG